MGSIYFTAFLLLFWDFSEIGKNGKGVGVAYFITNSTGKLAFLNNMVAVIEDEIQPNGDTLITAWEWSGE